MTYLNRKVAFWNRLINNALLLPEPPKRGSESQGKSWHFTYDRVPTEYLFVRRLERRVAPRSRLGPLLCGQAFQPTELAAAEGCCAVQAGWWHWCQQGWCGVQAGWRHWCQLGWCGVQAGCSHWCQLDWYGGLLAGWCCCWYQLGWCAGC